jgi:hypothetical protein
MHEHFKKYNTVSEWYSGITYKEACEYLDELCNSPGFERCSKERDSLIEERRLRKLRNEKNQNNSDSSHNE